MTTHFFFSESGFGVHPGAGRERERERENREQGKEIQQ
jgi:hypothetical protein